RVAVVHAPARAGHRTYRSYRTYSPVHALTRSRAHALTRTRAHPHTLVPPRPTSTVTPMNYLPLGRAAVRVSRLCLGTMNFGPLTSEADSFAIMDAALEAGINFFDTANVYGRTRGVGVTEEIV